MVAKNAQAWMRRQQTKTTRGHAITGAGVTGGRCPIRRKQYVQALVVAALLWRAILAGGITAFLTIVSLKRFALAGTSERFTIARLSANRGLRRKIPRTPPTTDGGISAFSGFQAYSHSIISQRPNPLSRLRLCASRLSSTVKDTAEMNRWSATDRDRSRKQMLRVFALVTNYRRAGIQAFTVSRSQKHCSARSRSQITNGGFYQREYDLFLLEPHSLT